MTGTNAAIILTAVLVGAAWTGVPLRLRPPLAGLALLGFVVLARPSPSVLSAPVTAVGLIALIDGGRPRLRRRHGAARRAAAGT